MSKFIVLIPARYASSRFPGKPLARIAGVEMIVRVCRRVAETGFPLAVATDDRRIFDTVTAAGYQAVMTSGSHRSGTDRIFEAYCNLGSDADVVINVQGDEPFIDPSQILSLAHCFYEPDTMIATLARRFNPDAGFEVLEDPNLVKLTRSLSGNALYFSRNVIPHLRGTDPAEWPSKAEYLTHVGIYAYRSDILARVTKMPQSPLEKAESLEQLRWLENGLSIKVELTDSPTVGIDTPEDLEAAERFLAGR